METDLIHQRESDDNTESFLQENIGKFEIDAVFLYRLMLKGERLTAKTVVQKYGKESRRLRDLFISGKCEREWVLNQKGKRMFVEYFISPTHPPTKSEVTERAAKVISLMQRIPNGVQKDLF